MIDSRKEELKTIIRSLEFAKAQLVSVLDKQESDAKKSKGDEKEEAEQVCDCLADALDCLESAVDGIYDAME